MIYKLTKKKNLKGEISVSSDKSISHRSVMFGSIANGTTEINNFLRGEDCLSTISCFRKLGIEIETHNDSILIHGKGLHGLSAPTEILDVGNSGTTARLISGILAGQPFESTLTGDASIKKRPMKRIIEPLSKMNAYFNCLENEGMLPYLIKGNKLKGVHINSNIASAQVKSAILLAGLYADSPTTTCEPYLSRNHTEILLKAFGADIVCQGTATTISPNPVLEGQRVIVPGDISSASYFIAAGLLVEGSEILLKNVGINPTRAGIIEVAKLMGGDITITDSKYVCGELVADILVRSSNLKGVTIEGSLIPTLIDEIPIIAIMAAFATGTTTINDAKELRVKETNRIDTVVNYLSNAGCDIKAKEDGMIINGGNTLHGIEVDSLMDHRLAMSFTILGLLSEGEMTINNSEIVAISYPDFYKDLESLY